MRPLISGFKNLTIGLLISLILSFCTDIPRDNLLDPKNPDSYRDQIIFIEAFVNTKNDELYNEYMISALKIIKERYPGKIHVANYHRSTTEYPDTTLAIPENENLYEQYIAKFDSKKGVPDVFINGTIDRIKGASSIEGAVERIEDAIQPLLIQNSFITVEPRVSRQDSTISLSAKIAKLGSESAEDLILRATLVETFDSEYLTRVVGHIGISNLIPNLEPGKQKEITLSDFNYDSDKELKVIFSVSTNQDLIIQQSIEVSVP
jgi:hypothetical protein